LNRASRRGEASRNKEQRTKREGACASKEDCSNFPFKLDFTNFIDIAVML